MNTAESRIISFGIIGSLAVHLLAVLVFACWVAFAPAPVVVPHPTEPAVEVIMPENIELVPQTPPPPAPVPVPPKSKPPARYIRTTQNESEATPPKKADFVSDRDTTAMAKLAPETGGDPTMPTTTGVKVHTLELANREYKDGQIKDDSTPSPPPAPPALVPLKKHEPEKPAEKKPPEPKPPEEKMAKKEDAPVEKMMKELDAALQKDGAEHAPVEIRKPLEVEKAPDMKLPDEPPIAQRVPSPPTPPPLPKPNKDAYAPQTRTSAAKGSISNVGNHDSVDAANTPTGRYARQIEAAIGKRWNYYRMRNGDFLDPCDLVLHFSVDKNGKVGNVKIILNKANVKFTDFTITAVLEAQIPPIPADLVEILDNERFEMDTEFLIY